MPVLLNKGIFYHIPKTGGTFVTRLLKLVSANPSVYERPKKDILNLQNQHLTPDDLDESLKDKRFSFAFIREPISWYKSLFYQQVYDGWTVPNYAVTECKSVDFEEFVYKCLELYPNGLASEVYRRFLGENADKVDFVGRTERLRDDLCYALDKSKERYEVDTIYNMPLVNESKNKNITYLQPGLKKKIIDAESWFYDRFITYD